MDNSRGIYTDTPRISFIPAPGAISRAVDNLSTRSLHVYDRLRSREKKWIILWVRGIAAQ